MAEQLDDDEVSNVVQHNSESNTLSQERVLVCLFLLRFENQWTQVSEWSWLAVAGETSSVYLFPTPR